MTNNNNNNNAYVEDTWDQKKPITSSLNDTIGIETKINSFKNVKDINKEKKIEESENSDEDHAPHRTESFLNNDGIDSLKPKIRTHRVSSLSLTDQVFNNLSISSTSSSSRRSSVLSMESLRSPTSGTSNITNSNEFTDRSFPLLNQNNVFGGYELKTTPIDSTIVEDLAPDDTTNPSSTTALRSNSNTNESQIKTIIDHERIASYAFAFDIDGVLIRGKETIPEAIEAMKLLNGENKYNIKVPYIFITNGGGNDEKLRCENLTKRLKCEIQVDQIIQGHTPMKSLTGKYKNVLVVGGVGDSCRKIALKYGFENVYIPLDIIHWNPNVSPYYKLSEEEEEMCLTGIDFNKTEIEAILVFADSRNWNVDQQIILELLLSKNGRMGTIDEPDFNKAPELYFAHSDFVWATDYKLNRYGMGALQITIAALYQEHTGGKVLKVNRFGKPQRGTFRFAEKVLSNWRKNTMECELESLKNQSRSTSRITSPRASVSENNNINTLFQQPNLPPIKLVTPEEEKEKDSEEALETENETDDHSLLNSTDDDSDELFLQNHQEELILPPASTVYFVGDTPESDIRFANSHDDSWFSILVKTGVYQDGSIPKYKPKKTVENVLEAVEFAIEREHQKELKEWNSQFTDL